MRKHRGVQIWLVCVCVCMLVLFRNSVVLLLRKKPVMLGFDHAAFEAKHTSLFRSTSLFDLSLRASCAVFICSYYVAQFPIAVKFYQVSDLKLEMKSKWKHEWMAGGEWTYGYYWNNNNEDGYESGYFLLSFCPYKSLQFFSFNILFRLEIVTL